MSGRRWPALVLALALTTVGCAAVSGTAAPVAGPTTTSSRASSPARPTPSSSSAAAAAEQSAEPAGGSVPADPTTEPTDGSDAPGSTASLDPTASPEGVGVDACRLVNQADAEKLAGTPLGHPQRGEGEHSCIYTGPTSGPTAQVEVYVGPGAQKQLDIEKTLQHPLRTLAHIGDEAWIGENGVYLRKGQLWMSVLVVLLQDPQQYAGKLATAASTAAGRL